MSLRPDDRSSRHRERSRSRSGHDRTRSRSAVRESHDASKYMQDQPAQYGYPYATGPGTIAMPSMPGMPDEPVSARDSMMPGGFPSDPKPRHAHTFPLAGGGIPYPTSNFFPDPDHFDMTGASDNHRLEDSLAFGSSQYPDNSHHQQQQYQPQHHPQHQRHESGYGQPYPTSSMPLPTSGAAPVPSPLDFYGSGSMSATSGHPEPHRSSSYDRDHKHGGHDSSRVYAPVAAALGVAGASRLSPSGTQENVVNFTPTGSRPRASSNLTPHMSHLTISGGPQHHGPVGGGLPPPSPLLEAYRGTYQSVSPMVAPMASLSDSDLSDLEPLSGAHVKDVKFSKSDSKSDKSKHSHSSSKSDKSKSSSKSKHRDSSPKRKHAVLYDSATEAAALVKALSHSHASNIDTTTITRILPSLTHDQMLDLRSEYKKLAKVNGKGINLSKHLKLKLTGNYGKAAHVCALGRWESEGYWANFFYQSHSSRRELIIEALMGRSNADIRAIKDGFRDKRYADDLEKMVARELRADKFRTAVGWVLEARRQEETEVLGEQVIRRDMAVLGQCLRTKEGGETAMLEVVVRRSDVHLREVLKLFEKEYKVNFAREALKRSGNLVGEVLAHILNGVINRPARDALLLKHAIQDIAAHNKDEELRYELLISRLIRFHWDRSHWERVKREYLAKNRRSVEVDIAEATKGDLRGFLVGLCEPRG